MDPSPPAHITAFVVELLNVGRGVADIIDNLADALTDATGESLQNSRHDVLAMCIGSLGVRLTATPREQVVRATELIRHTMDAMLADLHGLVEPAHTSA